MNEREPEPEAVAAADDAVDQASDQAPEMSQEALEELRERTEETMAEARREVDRAMETSHDQLMPAAQGEPGDYGDDEYVDEEGVPEDKEDTRGAWPNWTKRK